MFQKPLHNPSPWFGGAWFDYPGSACASTKGVVGKRGFLVLWVPATGCTIARWPLGPHRSRLAPPPAAVPSRAHCVYNQDEAYYKHCCRAIAICRHPSPVCNLPFRVSFSYMFSACFALLLIIVCFVCVSICGMGRYILFSVSFSLLF